ncbi:MAG: prepilin-type N-terminal cleavage/methylation domain-containing protein [Nitrospirae bacterium]|nr:prepilin-type N-terminal cleavage/methylation domain-containing protein [Nitrospirota bacterium]
MKINRPVKSGGFTLLEMIIVLFLISLTAGLTAVFFAGALPSEKLNAAAREISSTIRHAKNRAVISGERQVITINLDAKEYAISGKEKRVVPDDVNIRVINSASETVSRGILYFVFYPTGGAEAGTVVLSTKKKRLDIQIDPIIGSVIIKG